MSETIFRPGLPTPDGRRVVSSAEFVARFVKRPRGVALRVCSTSHLFHYLFHPDPETSKSIVEDGIRPLSDFPDSDRWRELEEQAPGFYQGLYRLIAEPVLSQPYKNSGIFITPIDFRLLPGTFLHNKPRFGIPAERVDPSLAVITYVLEDERVSLPFSVENLQAKAAIWDRDMVTNWFGLDRTKVFFYVPQVATYQESIQVTNTDYETI